MERITVSGPDGGWTIPEGRQEEAARRLAAFENAAQRLACRHGELAGRMEQLKAEGRQKSAQFREAFGEKLMIQNLMQLWETYGVKE